MLCIVLYFILWLKYIVKYFIFYFLSTRRYLRKSVNIKKICKYLHNAYPHGYENSTGQILIHWVGYRGTTICILPILLTSLVKIIREVKY